MKLTKYLFLPPFLTRYAERMLETMSRDGYALVSVERGYLFGYRFFFEPTTSPPRRYYVYRVEYSREDRYKTRCDEERKMLGERCCEPVYQDSFVFIAPVSADTTDTEINALICKRLSKTIRYYFIWMLCWILVLPLLFLILDFVTTGTTTWELITAWPITALLGAYGGIMALYCQWERHRLR